ncbi:MAG TPA: SAM-dependent methyltransferase [Syntrophorhabdaceae bacterium]|nr:SAM-dependent methyltransferase [Syntrophorhabdaceae bacterium]HPU29210.1 SAM-dependent methyltransferase [Syntrophorhabdaceae bacterium]
MRKGLLFVLLHLFVIIGVLGGVSSSMALTIGGSVRQPLNLTINDLLRFESVEARITEVTADNSYRGVFIYRGVPLKTLLNFAFIQKEEEGFSKPIDLAVVVRNREGKAVTLSWGEIFYRNPQEVMIAFSATPVIPHHNNCGDCHTLDFYKPVMDQLKRKVGFPKLVITKDFFTDRCLEEVIHIEVVNLKQKAEKKKMDKLFSPKFTIAGMNNKSFEINDLSGYRHFEVSIKQVGDGRGYHGLKRFSGVSLIELLKKVGVKQEIDSAILVSSIDGYRTLLSYGELFMAPDGERVMIADKIGTEPLKENGKFALVIPDDISADRMVKAVSKIEVISFKTIPKVYIIGMGCADTSLITLEAISYMGKADVFVAPEDIVKRFSKYMGDKPVLFDPLRNAEHMFKKNNPNLSEEELKSKLEAQRAADLKKIKDAFNEGKSIALLEYGDPTIYGAWQYWLEEHFRGHIEIVPGISAFNAANAMIGKHLGCKGSIILTVPKGLTKNEEMLKAIATNGDTIAIFIGLMELKNLVALLEKYYSQTTPVYVAYRAGYSESKHLLKTTLGEVISATEKEKERHLGMIYIGPCLK